jgi:peptidoglycan/LPS O-acetylase OafA/YrhL
MSANLDLLRALAVLMVLAQHLLRRAELLSVGPIPVETIGHFGVLLFFVHTSLVLMYSMHRASDRDAKELVRSFYIRRFFRIYPLSTVAIVAALVLGVTTMGPVHGLAVTARPNLVAVSSDLLMVQNLTQAPSIINVLWSLPYEIQMYLVLPFLFLWIMVDEEGSGSC